MLLGCGCGGVLELVFVALAGGATAGGLLEAVKMAVLRLLGKNPG